MSKYIDVEWLKQNFNTVFWSQITKTIDSAPSIDIVRCSECKYWRNKDPEQIPTASIMCGHMHPDDFCSYGEKENNGNQKI